MLFSAHAHFSIAIGSALALPGALPDAPEAIPGRSLTRSGPPWRLLQSPFWPKRHGGTPHMGKIVVKVDAFQTIFVFLAEKFRFLCCFSIFFVILGSRPFLNHNWVCSGAAGPPPRCSRTRSGPSGGDRHWATSPLATAAPSAAASPARAAC